MDIRKGSPTYGQWVSEILSAANKKQLWIPEGFAHGFLVLSDEAEIIYKTTDFYSPEHEHCLKYNDKKINITWPSISSQYLLSPKDAKGQSLSLMENILITGGAGYIGSHIALELLKSKFNVSVIDNLSNSNAEFT